MRMRLQWFLWMAGLFLGLQGCKGCCFTVYESCREDAQATLDPPLDRDASIYVPDSGVDAGFPGCIRAGCEAVCQGLDDPRQVCLFPACVACQRADAGNGAVFCGLLYTCGRDAGPPVDAGLLDAGAQSSSSRAGSSSGNASSSSSGSSAASSGVGSSASAAPSSSATPPSSAVQSSSAEQSSSSVMSSSAAPQSSSEAPASSSVDSSSAASGASSAEASSSVGSSAS